MRTTSVSQSTIFCITEYTKTGIVLNWNPTTSMSNEIYRLCRWIACDQTSLDTCSIQNDISNGGTSKNETTKNLCSFSLTCKFLHRKIDKMCLFDILLYNW
jgi:hypothetical protein